MPFETPSRRSPCEEVSFEYLANQQTGCKPERRSLFSSSRRRCPQFIPHNHLKRTALSSFRFLLSSFLSKFELQPSNGHIQTYSKFELLPSKQHDSVVLRLSAKKNTYFFTPTLFAIFEIVLGGVRIRIHDEDSFDGVLWLMI